jgi:hypothetical protein
MIFFKKFQDFIIEQPLDEMLSFFYVTVLMVHTNGTNFTTNSFTSSQTRILAQKNRQRIRPF